MQDLQTNEICVLDNNKPKVVVIGAGFAGINFIKKLTNESVQIILIDQNNFHQFQPLLYQVAISGLEPDSIATPIRKLFQSRKNLIYRMAKVETIDSANSTVYTDIGFVKYDFLVIATGSSTNYYGSKSIEQNSIGLKNIQNSINLRSWILQNLEKAVDNCNIQKKEALTKFIIVGGGPAGVEMAGALAEFKKYLLKTDYPEITREWMKIYLIQAGDRILPAMTSKSSDYALKVLKALEVEVMLNTKVKDFDGDTVYLHNGEEIQAKTLVWTAGVKGNCPNGIAPDSITKGNRIMVDSFNKVKGYENIFAIGDVSAMISDNLKNGHPMVAQVAIQQGNKMAFNLNQLISGKKLESPFTYKNKGSMATIGKKNAVADLNSLFLKGRLGWMLWSVIHLISITGFKKKFIVGINWAMKYFSYEKANQLIIRKYQPQKTSI